MMPTHDANALPAHMHGRTDVRTDGDSSTHPEGYLSPAVTRASDEPGSPLSDRDQPLRGGPHRIQRKRAAGWRMPEGAVYVGRPTKWGNPFVVREHRVMLKTDSGWLEWRSPSWMAHEWAVRSFRIWTQGGYPAAVILEPRRAVMLAALPALAGRDLACWCPLDQRCHADVLLELANGA